MYVWEKNWIIYSISISIYIIGKNDVRYIHTCSGPKWGLIAKIWTNFKLLEIIPAPNKPSEIKNGSLIKMSSQIRQGFHKNKTTL